MPFDPPAGLEIELVEIDGQTLLVFSWPAEAGQLPRLTAAERAVLRALTAGQTNSAIARARKTSVRTIANQVASLFRKFEVSSRNELAAKLSSIRSRSCS